MITDHPEQRKCGSEERQRQWKSDARTRADHRGTSIETVVRAYKDRRPRTRRQLLPSFSSAASLSSTWTDQDRGRVHRWRGLASFSSTACPLAASYLSNDAPLQGSLRFSAEHAITLVTNNFNSTAESLEWSVSPLCRALDRSSENVNISKVVTLIGGSGVDNNSFWWC